MMEIVADDENLEENGWCRCERVVVLNQTCKVR